LEVEKHFHQHESHSTNDLHKLLILTTEVIAHAITKKPAERQPDFNKLFDVVGKRWEEIMNAMDSDVIRSKAALSKDLAVYSGWEEDFGCYG
jgi:hypothetical protein